MKKTLLPIVSLVFTFGAFAQVENGGFENWTNLALFEEPDMGIEVSSSNYETFFDSGELSVSQISHEGGSAIRLENIAKDDEVIPGFFLTGMPPGQAGEMLIFDGGIPASDQNVTGLSMDLSYNIPAESPGFVIVQFKLEGQPVGMGNMGPGTFYFPISGEKDWGNETFDFGESFGTAFDQVVIGMACADLLNDDSPFVPDAWLEADNLEFAGSTDMIENGDFENWAMVPPLEVPVGVDTDFDPFSVKSFKSEDAYEGEYALGLISKEENGFVQTGRAIMGEQNENETIPGITINDEHSMVSFKYKYLAENDVAEAKIIFFEEEDGNYIPVMSKNIDLNPTAEYVNVEYPFAEDLEENFASPTKMSIEFMSSREELNPQDGSTLIIDKVEVGGTLPLVGIAPVDKPRVSAFPNPTLARVQFDFGVTRSGFYRVYNNQGFQIDYVQFDAEQRLIHDLSGLPSDTYVFRFYHSGGIETARVIKL